MTPASRVRASKTSAPSCRRPIDEADRFAADRDQPEVAPPRPAAQGGRPGAVERAAGHHHGRRRPPRRGVRPLDAAAVPDRRVAGAASGARAPARRMGAESRGARRLSSANAVVLLRPGDDLGRALKKLKDACAEAEVPRELKKRDHYVKPGEARRLKSRRAQIVDGFPKTVVLTEDEIRDALHDSVMTIVETVHRVPTTITEESRELLSMTTSWAPRRLR